MLTRLTQMSASSGHSAGPKPRLSCRIESPPIRSPPTGSLLNSSSRFSVELIATHAAHFLEWFPGLKMLAVADERFELLQRDGQAPKASNWIFHPRRHSQTLATDPASNGQGLSDNTLGCRPSSGAMPNSSRNTSVAIKHFLASCACGEVLPSASNRYFLTDAIGAG
jgi:hypothetical protein